MDQTKANTMRYCLTIISIVLLGCTFSTAGAQSEKPNIVYILADDLGYGDLSCYNSDSKIYTPNLDRLASEGICFTNAHSSASVCTPTRYGLMTGRYCWRTSRKKGVVWAWESPLLKKDRMTLPEMLKENGYVTGLIGKWHLGLEWVTNDGKEPNMETKGLNVNYRAKIPDGPINHGFDYYFGDDVPNFPPYAFIENDSFLSIPTELLPKDVTGVPGAMTRGWEFENVLPSLTRKAEDFITKNSHHPFFLFVSLTAPHEPIAPNKEFIGSSKAGRYGDFVQEVDARIGGILERLDLEGLRESTIVVFSSDNGPSFQDGMPARDSRKYESKRGTILKFGHNPARNLRGMKADAWEGGHRIPYIIRYPAGIEKGKLSDELICDLDIMKTLSDYLDYDLPRNTAEDSYSFASVLQGKDKKLKRDFIVSQSGRGYLAIQKDGWKLIAGSGSCGLLNPFDDSGELPIFEREKDSWVNVQLYKLDTDISERYNLASLYPQKVTEMLTSLSKIVLANSNDTNELWEQVNWIGLLNK